MEYDELGETVAGFRGYIPISAEGLVSRLHTYISEPTTLLCTLHFEGWAGTRLVGEMVSEHRST